MNDKNASAVKNFFDDYASKFYSIYLEEQKSFITRILDRTLRKSMFKRFQKVAEIIHDCNCKNIIDVGCGPGWHDVLLTKSQDVHVTGIDVAPNMIEIAKKLSISRNLDEKLDFIIADIFDHSFHKKYDCAFALGVVEYFENPKELIMKMKDISSKRVIFSIPVKNHILTFQRRIRYKLRNCPLWFYDKKDIHVMLDQIDIKEYKIHNISRDYLVEIIIS
tara:strand:+ start:110 stop:769 length:660 start_codon:yes stop_codon:yes gene_type:complete